MIYYSMFREACQGAEDGKFGLIYVIYGLELLQFSGCGERSLLLHYLDVADALRQLLSKGGDE